MNLLKHLGTTLLLSGTLLLSACKIPYHTPTETTSGVITAISNSYHDGSKELKYKYTIKIPLFEGQSKTVSSTSLSAKVGDPVIVYFQREYQVDEYDDNKDGKIDRTEVKLLNFKVIKISR